MKTPISVNEHGDVTTFATVQAAEEYMEPIDVEHGEYLVTDADGQKLAVHIVTASVPMFGGLWKRQVRKVRILAPTDPL